jgi:cytochrome P450
MTDDLMLRMADRFDHHDPELAAEGVSQRVYQHMRDQCPVQWTDSYDGFWVATRYRDIERVARDAENFASSAGITIPDPTDALSAEDRQQRFESGKGISGPPVMYDPPAHTAIRRGVEPLFAPGAVRQRQDYIRAVAEEVIDSFIEAGECDAINQICAPIPAIVVLNWLGLPEEDWKSWSDTVLAQFSKPGEFGIDMSSIDVGKILSTIQERKANPAGDVISAITQTTIDGEPLNDLEMLAMIMQLVFAGLDTTTNAAAGMLVELYRHPDLRTELAETGHDDRLWDTAIEEFLRYTCPIQGFKRTARTQTQVGDKTIQPGERVFMLWAAANFDEREFDRPHEINIRRPANRHMTFGRGIHRCLGSHLARLEMKVMAQVVLERMPDYTIDESKLRLHPDVGITYGYESIPLRFTPQAARHAHETALTL